MVSLQEAADYCCVPVAQLQQWTEAGYAPHFIIGDGEPRFVRTELLAWIKANMVRRCGGLPVPKRLDVLVPVSQLPASVRLPIAISTIDGLCHVPITGACPGIYFLCHGEAVVYVGQSLSVIGRIATHIKEGVKEFDLDRVYFLPCPSSLLDSLERQYIDLLRPKYNGGEQRSEPVVLKMASL